MRRCQVDGTESEGEGDDLRDFSAEDCEEDWCNEDEDNGADLDGFIVNDSEDEEPVENEVNDHEEELDHSEVEDNSDTELQSSKDEDRPIKMRTKRQRMIYSDSEDEPGVKQKTRDCEKEKSESDDGEPVPESSGGTQKSNNEMPEEIDQDASSKNVLSASESASCSFNYFMSASVIVSLFCRSRTSYSFSRTSLFSLSFRFFTW